MANVRKPTTTQIRNLYSDGMSYMNIKFFNMNLSISFQPFLSKDQRGISKYNFHKSITTTISLESAFALYRAASDIVEDKEPNKGVVLVIPCNNNVVITLDHKLEANGIMETFISISKDNQIIPFKFSTVVYKVMEDGKTVDKIMRNGLGAFASTMEGYLTGINADRHLDKLTEDYVKSLGDKANRGGYNNNYNNNYKKPYNNYNQSNQNQQPLQNQPPQQNVSTYTLPQS